MRNLEQIDLNELKSRLDSLSTASEKPVVVVEKDNTPRPALEFKAIVNDKDGTIHAIVSKGYTLIQHKAAFSAVVDALATIRSNDKVRATVVEEKGRAWLTVTFPEIKVDDGEAGIELGFKVKNSYDATTALTYSGTQRKSKWEESHFEFFGYRLACMNGMTMRIPMDFTKPVVEKKDAKVGDIVNVKLEKVEAGIQTTTEAAASGYIRHYGDKALLNLERMRQAFLQLPEIKRQLEQTIQTVRAISLTTEEAGKRLKELGFGERVVNDIMERFKIEEQTQWGLYNSITTEATHGRMKNGTNKSILREEEMLGKASKLLVMEVRAH
jgi:hypothetical protein